jgi:hypothetical protein
VAARGASVELGARLAVSKLGLPTACTIDACGVKMEHVNITFPDSGLTGDLLDLFRKQIASAVSLGLNTLGCDALRAATANITRGLRNLSKFVAPYRRAAPAPPAPPVPADAVDLRASAAADLVNWGANELVGPRLNDIFRALTKGAGVARLAGANLSETVTLGGLANVTVAVTAVAVDGLETWRSFELLEAVSATMLRSHVDLGELQLNVSFTVAVTPTGSVVAADTLVEQGEAVVVVGQSRLHALTELDLHAGTVAGLEPTQFLSPGCLLACVRNVSTTYMWLNFSVDELRVSSVSGNMASDLDGALDRLADLLTGTFGGLLPALLDGVVQTSLRPGLNRATAALLAANRTCAPPARAPVMDLTATYAAAAAAAATYALLCVALRGFAARPGRAAVELRVGLDADLLGEVVVSADTGSAAGLRSIRAAGDCLATHEGLPRGLRALVPLLLLGNVALFISANSAVGASVHLILTVGSDEVIQLPSLFDFSLFNSVQDMWNAGVYPLSLLIAVFSGFWPYAKLLLMLLCWGAPPARLPARLREQILMFLDAFGKWSLIDTYVLVMFMVAFHFHVDLAAAGAPAGTASAVDVVVDPGAGFYLFLGATMLSLLLSHLLLGCHRAAEAGAASPDAGVATALRSHQFRDTAAAADSLLPPRAKRLAFTPAGQAAVVALLLGSLALLLAGVITDAFAFEFKGAAGAALGVLNHSTTSSFSLVSLGVEIPDAGHTAGPAQPYVESTTAAGAAGDRVIQATYFAYALVCPALLLLTLLALWLLPLRRVAQRRVFVLAEVLNAWSAADVFVVSVVAVLARGGTVILHCRWWLSLTVIA